MSNWHCYTCKRAVEEQEIEMEFLDQLSEQNGLVCPGCNGKWLTEEVVVEEIAKAEAESEGKMA